MESPSEALHNVGSPWKGLLITAAVLSTWIQLASPQSSKMKVELRPPYGMVGGNITLSILGLSKEPRRYTWFKKTTDGSNRIVTYNVQTGQQTPANGRVIVFPNGTLLITNLTLGDSDEYIVEIFSTVDGLGNYQLSLLGVHLEVYDSNSGGGVVAGIVIGVLAGVALIGALIYFLYIRKTGRASQGLLGDPGPGGKTQPAQKPSQVLENIYWLQDSNPSAQGEGRKIMSKETRKTGWGQAGLGPTPTSSAAAPENVYQALDVSQVAVYERFAAGSKPQTEEGGRSP